MKSLIGALVGVLVALVLGPSTGWAQGRPLVLEGGTLIDGTGRPPIADAVVVTSGGRITAVGRRGQVTVPPGATVIRLEGRTVLPGLIDAHVHLREYQVPMFLPYGVTTIADIHNDTAWTIAQREALKSGRMRGPRLFVSGARVTGLGGNPTTDGSYVRTAEEARAYIRRLKAAGVDHVKVDLTITDDQLRAVIEESRAQGLLVLGHTQNIIRAVDMGMKHMEHMDTMARALLEQEGKDPRPQGTTSEAAVNPALFPALIERMVREGVFVNPTLYLSWSGNTERWRDWTRDAAVLAKDPALAFVPPDVKAAWVRPPARGRAGYENVVAFLRRYSEAGGKVLAATDTGCCTQIVPGLSLHYEMQMLTDMGITPMRALQGVTLWAAEVIGQQQDLGSVEVGKLADFTIVEGNPLADISATRNVRMVIKDGQVMDTSYDPAWTNPIPRRPAGAAASRWFDAPGTRIHFLDAGAGEPVVLLHGLTGSAQRHWEASGVMAALTAAGYRAVAMDSRGHGASDKPHDPRAYGLEMVQDVLRLLDHLQLDRAHIVGYSMGGAIATQMLVRHPDRAITITLLGAGWEGEDLTGLTTEMNTLADGFARGDASALVRRVSSGQGAGATDAEVAALNESLFARNDAQALAAAARTLPMLFQASADHLRAASRPVLGIAGEADDAAVVGIKRLAGVMPRLEVVWIPGATHQSSVRPAATPLVAFLNRHRGAR